MEGNGRPLDFPSGVGLRELQLRMRARTYVRHRYPPSPVPLWAGQHYRTDRIRVAYVSAEFPRSRRIVPDGRVCSKRTDRDRFETIALSLQQEDPRTTGQP